MNGDERMNRLTDNQMEWINDSLEDGFDYEQLAEGLEDGAVCGELQATYGYTQTDIEEMWEYCRAMES